MQRAVETISYRCSAQSPIDWIWFSRGTDVNIQSVCYPFLHTEYVINLGDLFSVSGYNDSYCTGSYHSWISGLHTAPIKVHAEGTHKAAGILFKPWGIYQAFGISPRELTNLAVDSKPILRSSLDDFFTEICSNQRSPDIESVEAFIGKNSRVNEVDPWIINVIDTLTASGIQRGVIKRLSSELETTSKTIISRFKDATGVTPLEYLHLKLVEIARANIGHDPSCSLTAIAIDLGFYDQAHFTRVFKRICRITPREYRKSLAA